MPVHNFLQPRGRIVHTVIESEAIRGNLQGDPAERTVAVYLPEGYDTTHLHYPLLVDLAAFTGSGLKRLSWQSFGESVPQRLDRLVAEGVMGPVVAVFPDAFTSLGGNQYVDSVAMGYWEKFLLEEMLPRIESEFRVRPGNSGRAVLGKSSGGYGALIQGMRHGDRWAAAACHSGDIGFEWVYRVELPAAVETLARHGGSVEEFLRHLEEADKIRGGEMAALMILAMAASYDPDPNAFRGIRLPVDPHTCELRPERWRNWLAHDPLTLVSDPGCVENLHRLKLLYFDCGSRDPFRLQYGARTLERRLQEAGVPHVYEEFDDDHSGIDYRLDRSLPLLYRAIVGA
jgi:S-formylglutathione hydrolase FrmB